MSASLIHKHPYLIRAIIALAVAILLGLAAAYIAYFIVGPTSTGDTINKYWFIFFSACFLCVTTLVIFRKAIPVKPDIPFFLILLGITVSLSLIIDINEPGWDTESHFSYTLTWTEIDLSVQATKAEADILTAPTITIKTNLAELENWQNSLNELDQSLSSMVVTSSLDKLYTRIGSLPSSLLYAVLNVLGVSFSSKYVLARLIYAFIYSFICFLGMRRLQSGKMIFASVVMIPTALFLASDYSYDYWVNCWMFYAIAQLVGEMQRPREKITCGRCIWMLASFCIACGPKAIYFPLVLLCLMMPRAKFKTTAGSRLFRVACVGVSMLIVSTFLLSFLSTTATSTVSGDSRGGENVNSGVQIVWIFSNPLKYASVLFGFLLQYLSVTGSQAFTTALGYFESPNEACWLAAVTMMIFTCITDKKPCDIRVNRCSTRIFVAIITYGTICLVATSLYISFTPVGYETVNGCQGRYLLPCILAPLLFFGIPKLTCRWRWRTSPLYNIACLAILSAIPLISFWQVYVSALV